VLQHVVMGMKEDTFIELMTLMQYDVRGAWRQAASHGTCVMMTIQIRDGVHREAASYRPCHCWECEIERESLWIDEQ
jgi:hypothetical protein